MKNFARESPLSSLPPNRMFVWPLEMMLRFNASIANAVQESTVTWAQRRQEATKNAAQTFERLVRCRNLGEAISIQQEWIENNIRRCDENFGALADHGANLAHRAASTARDAIDESSNAGRAVTREAEETEPMVRDDKEAEQSMETPRRAAHRMHRGSRRATTRGASKREQNKRSRKPHKARKRRAA